MKQAHSAALLLAMIGPLAACASSARGPHVGAPPAPEASRPELLNAAGQAIWRGDLTAARQALAELNDRAPGQPDPELDYWSEFLALLDCRGLATAPRSIRGTMTDPWIQLRRLVQLERTRLQRETTTAVGVGDPARQRNATEIAWPPDSERWPDERPVAARSSTGCPIQRGPVATTVATAAEIAAVAETARELQPRHPARAVLLLHAAIMEIERGHTAAAGGALRALEGEPTGVAALLPAERADLAIASALHAETSSDVTAEQIVARLQFALEQDLPPAARRGLQLRLSERLRAIGRAEDAATLIGPPPHGDDAVGRYLAFRQAEAHARAGRRAEVLAEARAALAKHARHTIDRDPALRALMDIALRTLLASPVSNETMEVLEAIGPPRERLSRAETFARLALTSGMFESAAHVFAWLSENDQDSNRQLQHLARAAVAAARGGDKQQFSKTFKQLAGEEDLPPPATSIKSGAPSQQQSAAERRRAIAGRPGELIASDEANRARGERRKARSVNWQRALLVVARDALPSLVDADDQPNLATLVDVLQRHLEAAGRGPVDDELTTLYRAASAHLKTGARAYAENVGSTRRPIFLGDIILDRKYEVTTPRIEVVPKEPRPLIFVPVKPGDPTSVVRWPGSLGVAWKGRST